jgi:hypothetical protein
MRKALIMGPACALEERLSIVKYMTLRAPFYFAQNLQIARYTKSTVIVLTRLPITRTESISIRGCLIHDIGGGANAAYLNCRGASQYCYNNVFYGTFSAQRPIEIEPYAYGSGGNQGNVYIWNNTIVNDAPSNLPISIVDRGGSPQPNLVQVQNNLVINANTIMGGGPAGTITQDHNLMQTTAQASAAGYTQSKLWAPIAATSPSVDIGITTPSGIFTTDILGVTRPQGKGWDVGAYEFSSSPGGTPSPTPSSTPGSTPQTPQNLRTVPS